MAVHRCGRFRLGPAPRRNTTQHPPQQHTPRLPKKERTQGLHGLRLNETEDCEISRGQAAPGQALSAVRGEEPPLEAQANLEVVLHGRAGLEAHRSQAGGLLGPNPSRTLHTRGDALRVGCRRASLPTQRMTRGGARAPRGARGGNIRTRRGPAGGQTATPSKPSKCPRRARRRTRMSDGPKSWGKAKGCGRLSPHPKVPSLLNFVAT